MSMSTVLLEGLRRAATYAAMLFNLNSPPPAPVEPPLPAPEVVALAVDGSVAATGLTLAAHHVDARIAGGRATVQQQLLLRNDTAAPIAAQYLLAHPARVTRGEARSRFDHVEAIAPLDEDLLPQTAERLEAGRGRPLQRLDVIVVAPGEEIGVEVERELPLTAAGGGYRMHLPLPVDPAAPWVPRFTADVLVEAEQPIRRLSSPTHSVLVDGVGSRTALLSVEEGRAHRRSQLAVEFELQAATPAAPLLALDGATAGRNR